MYAHSVVREKDKRLVNVAWEVPRPKVTAKISFPTYRPPHTSYELMTQEEILLLHHLFDEIKRQHDSEIKENNIQLQHLILRNEGEQGNVGWGITYANSSIYAPKEIEEKYLTYAREIWNKTAELAPDLIAPVAV